MTVRVYKPLVGEIDKISVQSKRNRLVMERKNVSRIIVYNGPAEQVKRMKIFTDRGEEMIGHSDYSIEIMEGDPKDGLTEGISLTY